MLEGSPSSRLGEGEGGVHVRWRSSNPQTPARCTCAHSSALCGQPSFTWSKMEKAAVRPTPGSAWMSWLRMS